MSKWIDVKEKLPPIGEEVNVRGWGDRPLKLVNDRDILWWDDGNGLWPICVEKEKWRPLEGTC